VTGFDFKRSGLREFNTFKTFKPFNGYARATLIQCSRFKSSRADLSGVPDVSMVPNVPSL
jgi:hypothetical protein